MPPICVKCVLLGDFGIGKSSLYHTYITKKFPPFPTNFENSCKELHVDGEDFMIALWEPEQGEDAGPLRPLAYPQTNVFILAFAVNDKDSYNHIKSLWVPEVRKYQPKVPILLLGTKTDLRASGEHQGEWISTEMGNEMAQSLQICKYMECSSLVNTNVVEVIEEAARIGLVHSKNELSKMKKLLKCLIL